MTTSADLYATVFDAYYGAPERYQEEEEVPQFVSSGDKVRPFIRMMFPGGRQVEYLFGDHLNMLAALNHRRSGGRFAKFLEDAHDANTVTEKTDLTTGQKLLSNRQKKEWEQEQDRQPAQQEDWESNPSAPEPGMEDKYAGENPATAWGYQKHPNRIQLSRQAGFRLPTDAVVGARPGPLGNPWEVGEHGSRSEVIDKHRRWLQGEDVEHPTVSREQLSALRRKVLAKLSDLKQKKLACWCPPDKPCHCDTLAEMAEQAPEPRQKTLFAQSFAADVLRAYCGPTTDAERYARGRKPSEGQVSLFDKGEPEPKPTPVQAPSKPVITEENLRQRSENRPSPMKEGGYESPGQAKKISSGQMELIPMARSEDQPSPTKEEESETAYPMKTVGTESKSRPMAGQQLLTSAKTGKAIVGRGELGASEITSEGGNVFHITNPQPQGLPPKSTVFNVKNVEHNGKLYRLSYVSSPEGNFIHVEQGVPKESREGHATIEMQPLSPEAHAAMQYMDTRHPLISAARELIHGKSEPTSKTKEKSPLNRREGERPEAAAFRETAAESEPLSRKMRAKALKALQSEFNAADLEYKNAIREVTVFENQHPDEEIPSDLQDRLKSAHAKYHDIKKRQGSYVGRQPPVGTPPVIPGGTEPRSDVASQVVSPPSLPTAKGPMSTPPEQMNPRTRTYVPYTISAAAAEFADAVVSRYTQDRAADALMEQFCAAYYGNVEKYGGMQSGHHIDFHGFDGGVPRTKMLEPFKMQAEIGAGPPRHMAGTGEKAGTFKSNPLAKAIGASTSPTNKYAATSLPKQHESLPGQTLMFADEPEATTAQPVAAEAPAKKTKPPVGTPQHTITFGLPSATKGVNLEEHGGHAKVLAGIGLSPAVDRKSSETAVPLIPERPNSYYRKLPDADLIDLHRNKRDEAATSELLRRTERNVAYHQKRNPSRREEIAQLVNAIETEKGEITPGTFQRAIESYDPAKGANFATHHNQILSNYIRSRMSRQTKREEKTPGARGVGTASAEPEQQRARDIADTSAPQTLDELLGDQLPPKRPREASSEEQLLHGTEGEGRHAKQMTLQRQADVMRDRISKMKPEDQWLMHAHLAGLSERDIASVLRAAPGSEQLTFLENHENPGIRAISDDAFRSKVASVSGKRPESIQFHIDTLLGSLKTDPTMTAVRERRKAAKLTPESFADAVWKALTAKTPEPRPKEPEVKRITPFEPISRLPAKRLGKLKRQAIRQREEASGKQPTLFTAGSKYSAGESDILGTPLGYEDVLQSLPENKTDINPSTRRERTVQPMPPSQPTRTGEERWATHTGETADINELRRIQKIATKYGLLFRVRVPKVAAVGKQQMPSVRWFTFTPAKWKERFQQRGAPERYRADKSNYAWFGFGKKAPSKPAAPPPTDFASHSDLSEPPKLTSSGKTLSEMPKSGSAPAQSSGSSLASGLGMVAAGLLGGRRGSASLARSLAGQQPRKTTARPTQQQPTQQRQSSPSEMEYHKAFMKHMAKWDAWIAGGMKGPSPSREQAEAIQKGATQKAQPKTSQQQSRSSGKPQMSPEERQRRESLSAKKLENQELRAKLEAQSLEQKQTKLEARGKLMLPPELKVKKVLPTNPPPPPNEFIPHIKGKATKILTEDLEPVDAYYALIDLRNAQPSHLIDKDSRITRNTAYPRVSQPREYTWGSNNHYKVLRHVSQKHAPYYTSDDPSPTGGPASLTPRGFVHNGNGRMVEQMYAAALDQSDPNKGHYNWISDAFEDEAEKFGINPEEVRKMRKEGGYPSIVRMTPGVQEGTDEFDTLARAGNRPTTEVEDPVREAVSNAPLVFKKDAASQLAEVFKSETNLSNVLQKPNHKLVRLIHDIVRKKGNYASYFDKKGRLHQEGKNRVENMLLGTVIPDADLLQSLDYEARSFKNAIGDALPSIIKAGDAIRPPLENAMRFIVENPEVQNYKQFVHAYNQGALEFPGGTTKPDQVTLELLNAMYHTKNKGRWSSAGMRSVFQSINGAIAQHKLESGGTGMFAKKTKEAETPEEKANQAKQLESDLIKAIRAGAHPDAIAAIQHREARQQQEQQDDGEGVATAQSENDEEGTEQTTKSHAQPVSKPATPAPKPKPAQKSMFADEPPTKSSLRGSRDAALELYSQVHMMYYGTAPHQRVARKNSSPKNVLQS